MSDTPEEFDLKFLPDWLKESPAKNPYADFAGDTGDRPRRDRDDRSPRGPRPERRGPAPGGERRGPAPGGERRGPRPDRPPGGDRGRGPRPGGDRPRGDRPGGDRRAGGRPPERRDAPRPVREKAPAQLKIEFVPEPNAAAGIAKQIHSSGRAYPVFGTAKLFLDRPERYLVRVTSSDPAVALFQIGDGPVSFDRAVAERNAFLHLREQYYASETVQGEPIKGNFTNVARCRATGSLLGPTNHHGYQTALRKLYEERFSRQMSFPQFQQYEIDVVTDEQTVADWKEQARSTTTYTTTQEAEPVTFKTLFDAEQHFKKTYLPQLVKTGTTLECSGQASRVTADRHVAGAALAAWEAECRFPQQMVSGLGPYFNKAGLTYFKHQKRMLYVCATKPQRHPLGQTFSDGISAILGAVELAPRIKRPQLAVTILGELQDTPEATARKAQLASDLHFLTHAGHVIEFADGTLELPLDPKAKPEPAPKVARKSGSDGAVAAVKSDVSGNITTPEAEITTPEAEPESEEMPPADSAETGAVAAEPDDIGHPTIEGEPANP
ncbi:MAG: hypothetical protein K8R23_00590 [Chthoniobacter sp.]|nr:hypothetical protein [Chthoniobacter sp.]